MPYFVLFVGLLCTQMLAMHQFGRHDLIFLQTQGVVLHIFSHASKQTFLGKVRFLLGWGGRGGAGAFWVYCLFWSPDPPPWTSKSKAWPYPKDHLKNVWPSPSPLTLLYTTGHLTACLHIVTHCHNTVAKRGVSLSHNTINLKFCASDSLNKYCIRTFVKKRTSVISILKENIVGLTRCS